MQTKRLGRSPIFVSKICMGTMTFGSQADEKMAHRILDKSLEAGINFFDTAENYPVPPREDWAGTTEEIVGRWLKTKRRDEVIIATKVSGPSHGWLKSSQRAGMTALDRHNVMRAVEASLKRLGTDYIDLYQTHWPDHGTGYEHALEALGGRQAVQARRFVNEKSLASTERYGEIAREAGMSLVTLATAWSKQHDFVASTIVGVSHEDQLPDIFAAADLTLSPEVMAKIDAVSKEIMYPMG